MHTTAPWFRLLVGGVRGVSFFVGGGGFCVSFCSSVRFSSLGFVWVLLPWFCCVCSLSGGGGRVCAVGRARRVCGGCVRMSSAAIAIGASNPRTAESATVIQHIA